MKRSTGSSFFWKIRNLNIDSEHGIFGNMLIVDSGFMQNLPSTGAEFELSMTMPVKIEQTSGNRTILFTSQSYPGVKLEPKFELRNLNQNDTLRGLERAVAWFQNGGARKPTDDECEMIHEGFLDLYAPRVLNPLNDREIVKRTSSMSRQEMSGYIDRVINHVGTMDIPERLQSAIDVNLGKFWNEFYRMLNDKHPILYEGKDWEEYCAIKQVCEFTGLRGTDRDPLVKMHVVSRGADAEIIDESWNWIRGRQSVHQKQHDKGWSEILRTFPHMRGKVLAVREKAQALNYKIEGDL